MERTLVLIKPDAVRRRLAFEILARFERKGLNCVGLKLIRMDRKLAKSHYGVHSRKPFFKPLVEFITSGPVIACVLEGNHAIAVVRKMMGATFGRNAEPGTIRGDYGISDTMNLVHGSDAPETAREEIARFFKKSELVKVDLAHLEGVYDLAGGKPV